MVASLPRRARLGIELCPEPFSAQGMRLAGGDLVVAIDGAPMRTEPALARALRLAKETVEIEIDRGGVRDVRTMDAPRVPDEADTRYECVRSDGLLLRTLVTRPRVSGKLPAVLIVQGLSCESVETGPLASLARGLSEAGFVTMRLDKRGVGDSEGDDASATDFDSERRDFTRALEALSAREDVGSVFVFGHSVGGMLAPFIGPARGLIVFGTSSRPWFDCVEATTRRQLALRGTDEIDRRARAARCELESLSEKDAAYRLDGRTANYHLQLQALDLVSAWRAVRVPTLVLHGEYDWVVGEDEMPNSVSIPSIDHLLTRHASLEGSLLNYGRGSWDDSIVHVTSTWMRRQLS